MLPVHGGMSYRNTGTIPAARCCDAHFCGRMTPCRSNLPWASNRYQPGFWFAEVGVGEGQIVIQMGLTARTWCWARNCAIGPHIPRLPLQPMLAGGTAPVAGLFLLRWRFVGVSGKMRTMALWLSRNLPAQYRQRRHRAWNRGACSWG